MLQPKPLKKYDPTQYAAIAVKWDGKDLMELLAFEDKILIFDNAQIAQEFMPLIGGGRVGHWTPSGECVSFSPIERDGINRAEIVTHYDIYNLPPGHPCPSETRLVAWKHHVHWGQLVTAMNEARGPLQFTPPSV